MSKRWLVVVAALAVAGCQGPEAFRGGLSSSGGPSGAAGSPGAAGTGIPIPTTGEAGTGAGGTGTPIPTTGQSGSAGPTGLAGAGGTGGDPTGGAGVAGTGGDAGTGAGGTLAVDAGAGGTGGRRGGFDGGARDAQVETAPPSVPYASTNWKPTASITAAGNADVATNAFDGKIATRWSTGHAQTGGETFLVDLGQTMSVSRVVLDDTTNPQDFPAGYTLEVSTNGTTFTAVKMGKGATVTDIQFARVDARYVRIRQTATGGSWWSIDELKIYS
jgi:hypothetical protein